MDKLFTNLKLLINFIGTWMAHKTNFYCIIFHNIYMWSDYEVNDCQLV